MAKVRPHPLMGQISGEIAGLVYYPHPDGTGELIVQPKRERRAPPSPAQIAYHQRVKLAASYANTVKRSPILAETYRPFCRGRMTPYQAAFRDFLKSPVIQGIDLEGFRGKAGEIIQITASDDTQVTGVHVVFRTVDEVVLEEGPAAMGSLQNTWVYATQAEIAVGTGILVEASAMDRPGNVTTAKVHRFVPP